MNDTFGAGNPELKPRENVLYGCFGAFLLSLVGGAATILLLQINVIAGIAGALGIVLGYWGYKKFSKEEYSRKGLWLSIVISVIVQIGAYFIGVVILIFREADLGFSLGETFKLLPELMEIEDFRSEVIGDLVKLLAFMAIASLYLVINTLKQIKTKQEQEASRSILYRDHDCDAD